MCFGTVYDVLAGARTRERTNLRYRTMSPGWRYGALVSHSKLAIRAYVDQTKLYQLGICNIQPEQRATGPLARSECDAPLLRAGPQYRAPSSTPRRRAPHRLSRPTQHRGVLGIHRGSPRLDCRPAVCVQRANRARQQSARASQRECRDCKDGQRNAKPIGKGGTHSSGKGTSSSGKRSSAPAPGRSSTRAAHDGGWLLLLLAREQRSAARLDDSAEGVLRACQAAVGGARERCKLTRHAGTEPAWPVMTDPAGERRWCSRKLARRRG